MRSGSEVLNEMENIECESEAPKEAIVIVDCGEVIKKE